MTYAEPPGCWSSRNRAVAIAEVQMASSGTSRPAVDRRARRSRGVKIELLVSTRNRRPRSCIRASSSAAPGSTVPSCTRTPSMSVSQHSIARSVTGLVYTKEPRCRPLGGSDGAGASASSSFRGPPALHPLWRGCSARERSSVTQPTRGYLPIVTIIVARSRLAAASGAVVVLAALAGCSAGGRGNPSGPLRAAEAFEAALEQGDQDAACDLLAPPTRDELEQSQDQECPEALREEDLPSGGSAADVQVFGDEAFARMQG